MTRSTLIIAVLLAFASSVRFASAADVAEGPTTQPETTKSGQSYAGRYSVLAERNVFLKDRSQPNRRSAMPTTRPHVNPDETFVLRGIAIGEDDELRAYFEDVSNARLVRVSQHDAIGRGHIGGIFIDGVEFIGNDGAVRMIAIGNDLGGMAPRQQVGAAPTSEPAIDPNDPNLTIEQKMKLRRQQQLKK